MCGPASEFHIAVMFGVRIFALAAYRLLIKQSIIENMTETESVVFDDPITSVGYFVVACSARS